MVEKNSKLILLRVVIASVTMRGTFNVKRVIKKIVKSF